MTNEKAYRLALKYKSAPLLLADFKGYSRKPSEFFQLIGVRPSRTGKSIFYGYIKNRSAN